MLEFMKLELRKQRTLFRALVASYVFNIALFGPLLAVSGGISWKAGAAVSAVAWAVAGLPVLTLLFGAVSGGGLRTEPAASAEAILPLSPGRKMAGALAAAAVLWITLSGLVLVSSAFIAGLSPDTMELRTGWSVLALGLPCGLLLFNAFTFAYAFRQGMAGALLALLLGALTFAGIGLGLLVRAHQHNELSAVHWAGAVLVSLAALAGPVFALRNLARWGERRVLPGVTGWLLIAAGLGEGAFAATGWLAAGYHALAGQLLFEVSGDPDARYVEPLEKLEGRQALLKTRDGALLAVDGAGKRTVLMAPAHENPVTLLRFPWVTRFLDHAWDGDGTLWVLVRASEGASVRAPVNDGRDYELWRGDGTGLLKMHGFFKTAPGVHASGLRRHDGTLGIYAWNDGRDTANLFAPLPAAGRSPEFQPILMRKINGRLTENPGYFIPPGDWVEISADGTTLARRLPGGGQTWRLPPGAKAAAVEGTGVAIRGARDARFFPVAVKFEGGDSAVAICGPEGAVTIAWRAPGSGNHITLVKPEGDRWIPSVAAFTAGGKQIPQLFILERDGTPRPPLALDDARLAGWLGHAPSGAERHLFILGQRGERLWLRTGDRQLLEVASADGSLVSRHLLPDFETNALDYLGRTRVGNGDPSGDGLFFIAGDRLRHAGWDGKIADLGPAFF